MLFINFPKTIHFQAHCRKHLAGVNLCRLYLNPAFLSGFHYHLVGSQIGYLTSAAASPFWVFKAGLAQHSSARTTSYSLNLLRICARGTIADDALHPILCEQLIGIDTDTWHTHSAGHDSNLFALNTCKCAKCCAPDSLTSHPVQPVLGNEFRPQRISQHQYGFAISPGAALLCSVPHNINLLFLLQFIIFILNSM